jgi:hypothetical protein
MRTKNHRRKIDSTVGCDAPNERKDELSGFSLPVKQLFVAPLPVGSATKKPVRRRKRS